MYRLHTVLPETNACMFHLTVGLTDVPALSLQIIAYTIQRILRPHLAQCAT